MKKLLFVLSILLAYAAPLSAHENPAQTDATRDWQLTFENDAEGGIVAGSKEALLAAIRAGKPVRIYTAGRRIEHASDVQFLSIFEGEAFAQTAAIEAQQPQTEPLQIRFRKPGIKWRSIRGTNGYVTAFMDGSEPNVRTGGTRWFVKN